MKTYAKFFRKRWIFNISIREDKEDLRGDKIQNVELMLQSPYYKTTYQLYP